MSLIEGILLGVEQGATEFMPISSSGHLVVIRYLLGTEDTPLLFDVLLHVATLVAICIVLRRPLLEMIAAGIRLISGRRRDDDRPALQRIGMLCIASLCTAAPAFLLASIVEQDNLRRTGICFLVTCALLALMLLRHPRTATRPSLQQPALQQPALLSASRAVLCAVAVGLAQGIAVLPGISRAGITIVVAVLIGMDRRAAGEFSFTLAIPAILGALLLTARDGTPIVETYSVGTAIIAMAAAFVVGIICLHMVITLLRRGALIWFIPYLLLIGILSIYFG